MRKKRQVFEWQFDRLFWSNCRLYEPLCLQSLSPFPVGGCVEQGLVQGETFAGLLCTFLMRLFEMVLDPEDFSGASSPFGGVTASSSATFAGGEPPGATAGGAAVTGPLVSALAASTLFAADGGVLAKKLEIDFVPVGAGAAFLGAMTVLSSSVEKRGKEPLHNGRPIHHSRQKSIIQQIWDFLSFRGDQRRVLPPSITLSPGGI